MASKHLTLFNAPRRDFRTNELPQTFRSANMSKSCDLSWTTQAMFRVIGCFLHLSTASLHSWTGIRNPRSVSVTCRTCGFYFFNAGPCTHRAQKTRHGLANRRKGVRVMGNYIFGRIPTCSASANPCVDLPVEVGNQVCQQGCQ